jgi:hypothetical protein
VIAPDLEDSDRATDDQILAAYREMGFEPYEAKAYLAAFRGRMPPGPGVD